MARIGVPGLATASTPMSVRPSLNPATGFTSPVPFGSGRSFELGAYVSFELAADDVENRRY